MKYIKKWILFSLLAIFATISTIASVNFFIDPLWTFEHEHKFNQFQKGRKERQQKSNALFFRSQKYTTLIFGSSRTSYMNPYIFGKNVFNYAVSDMQPREYATYLDFAINKAKQPIKTVIIGLDFFGALEYEPFISKEPQLILEKITEPLYRYKLLLSIDTINYTKSNIKNYIKKADIRYTYNYIKTTPPKSNITPEQYDKKIQNDLEIYSRDRYKHKYDENYKKYITELVASHKDINFIVFTTPVSKQHFETMISHNLYDEYERWLKESVDIFGVVHNFMYLNDLTKNANIYFMDSNHGYGETYECLANELLNKSSLCPRIEQTLDKTNLTEQLQTLREVNLIK